MDKFPDTCDRFIAYFDVLGFENFSYRNSHEDVAKMMNLLSELVQGIRDVEQKLLKQETEPKEDLKKAIVMPVIFSDTIILISGSNTIIDAHKSILAASFLLFNMMKNKIPVKGALAYGRLTADFNKSVYFGRPLIDAYLLSEETHFYGATLHHSFEKYLSEKESEYSPNIILKQRKVPMKTGQVTHYFVNWKPDVPPGDDEKKVREEQKAIVEEFYLSASGNVRKYVDNTLSVYFP